jgi:phytoene dehydrogenase-like protein
VLLDLVPRGVLAVAGDRLPAGYRRALARYRHAPGSCKVDWALSEPIPWRAAEVTRAATVHVGGTMDEIAAYEREVAAGRHAGRPFVILSQPTLVDPSRAPAGRHTAWAYCHVPSGSPVDMTEAIEAQVERFAPGFRDVVLARSTLTAAGLEAHNPNLVGGDVTGGLATLGQLLTRPALRANPYSTPLPGLYVCSAATPPGGGVHGMCGARAAASALAYLARGRNGRRRIAR